MHRLSVRSENVGSHDVKVSVVSDVPVEFLGALAVVGTNSAIYANGSEVKFRLAGQEPSAWMTTTAERHNFNTASRFFEKGA